MLQRLVNRSCALFGASLLAGCQTVVQVDRSALDANKSMASYNAASSLLNVVRASKNEPPVFAPITGLTGHNTLSGTLGLPSVTVGGANPASAVFGSNSVTRSVSADFNVNPPDDAQVNKALSTPIDPGTLGLLAGQGFQRDLLLYLFVDEIRVERPRQKTLIFVSNPFREVVAAAGANSVIVGESKSTWTPHFAGQAEFEAFGAELDALMRQGLTFQVDRQGFGAGGPRPTARACFDDANGMIPTAEEPAPEPGHQPVVDAIVSLLASLDQKKALGNCTDDWSSDIAAAPKKHGKPAAATPIDRMADALATALNGPKPKPTQNDSFWSYGKTGSRVRIHTRSIAGAYQFLGVLQRNGVSLRVTRIPDQPKKVAILDITAATKGCFTGFLYEGRPWCVPEDPSAAPGQPYPPPTSATKQTLALLHTTLELYLSAQNSTTTATTRSIP